MKQTLFLISFSLSLLVFNPDANSQSYRYWTRNFNDVSSLLAGAVVGGGIGPSAIYFNPAGISMVNNSSLSVNASLFSYYSYNIKNVLGDDINLKYDHFQVQPRFISYLIQPKKNENFSIEIAFLNNENYQMELSSATDQYIDILTHLPGTERYFATYQFNNDFENNWIGVGTSWKIKDNFHLGASMFAVFKSLEYRSDAAIQAFPLSDTIQSGNEQIPFYVASFGYTENYHFNDYRLLFKLGMVYQKERFSLGLVIRLPSIHVYSDGKRILHQQSQGNITNPDGEEFLPNYTIADYKEKKNVDVNYKDPLSISIGFTLHSKDERKSLYTTFEYYTGLTPYTLIQGNVGDENISGGIADVPSLPNWMKYTLGARPVLNAALGYSIKVKDKLTMLGGFRTDFNYRKGMDYLDDPDLNVQVGLDFDAYHLTYGISAHILGQDLIAGFQYSFGAVKHHEQYINFSSPVEYNVTENAPLQGTRVNNAKALYNSVSIYFGATFNFGTGKKAQEKKQ